MSLRKFHHGAALVVCCALVSGCGDSAKPGPAATASGDAWSQQEKAMQNALEGRDWLGLLELAVKGRSLQPLSDGQARQLEAQAALALDNLLKSGREEALAAATVLLEKENWPAGPQRALLLAKVRLKSSGLVDALRLYGALHALDPAAAAGFGAEMAEKISQEDAGLVLEAAGPNEEALLLEIKKLSPACRQILKGVALLESKITAMRALRAGYPKAALEAALDAVQQDTEARDSFRQLVAASITKLEQRPAVEILQASSLLSEAGEFFLAPAPFLLLTRVEKDNQKRFDYFRKAEELGSKSAKAHAGRYLLEWGVAHNSAEHLKEGRKKLEEAAKDDAEAKFLLANALAYGHGMDTDLGRAFALAKSASEDPKLREAVLLAGIVQSMLAEQEGSAEKFQFALALLEDAAGDQPGAWFYIFMCKQNEVVRDQDGAAEALRKGAAAQDANCLNMLGLCLYEGRKPFEQNLTQGRASILQAAKLGHARAKQWLQVLADKLRVGAKEADLKWIKDNESAWK